MSGAEYGVKPGQHIPGAVVHKYLTNYATRFGVLNKIRFHSKVTVVEKKEDQWILTVQRTDENTPETQVVAKKLVFATGLTNEPFIPTYAGREEFTAPLFHSKEFLQNAETLDTAKTAVVLGGGNKSAFDVAYKYAMSGTHVHMVIRKSGHGPVMMAPPIVTPFKKRLEKLTTLRYLMWLSPCIWGHADGFGGIRRFFAQNFIGRFIVNTFWWILGTDVYSLCKFESHPETAKLKPWSSAADTIYVGCNLSLFNYPTDFLQLVRDGKVSVHVADVTRLSGPNKVHLSTGTVLETDVVVCASGWKKRPPIKFLPEGLDAQLGLPVPVQPNKLRDEAEEEILRQFPRFRTQPSREMKRDSQPGDAEIKTVYEPFRLFRFMVPPTFVRERNVAFAGMLLTLTTPLFAHFQALWLSAYFDGVLPIKSSIEPSSGDIDKDIQWETMLQSQFGKIRYPCGYGPKHPDCVFDSIPYVDLMMRELGLKIYRKPTLFKELFEPYGPQDYRTVVEEWIARRKTLTNGMEKSPFA